MPLSYGILVSNHLADQMSRSWPSACLHMRLGIFQTSLLHTTLCITLKWKFLPVSPLPRTNEKMYALVTTECTSPAAVRQCDHVSPTRVACANANDPTPRVAVLVRYLCSEHERGRDLGCVGIYFICPAHSEGRRTAGAQRLNKWLFCRPCLQVRYQCQIVLGN